MRDQRFLSQTKHQQTPSYWMFGGRLSESAPLSRTNIGYLLTLVYGPPVLMFLTLWRTTIQNLLLTGQIIWNDYIQMLDDRQQRTVIPERKQINKEGPNDSLDFCQEPVSILWCRETGSKKNMMALLRWRERHWSLGRLKW